MSNASNEAELLQAIIPGLEAEGFDVYLHPSRTVVPSFLGKLQPDAIALGAEKNLVIEVVGSSEQASKKAEHLGKLITEQPDWDLRVLVVTPTSTPKKLQVQPANMIESTLREVQQLNDSGHPDPALLLGWAAFEALGRALLPHDFARPQTPGRLVEMLAQGGQLTPNEADEIRRLVKKRNGLIHGELSTRVSISEISQFVAVLSKALESLKP